MRLFVVTSVTSGLLCATVAGAQNPREFVAQARAATERFKDQAVATTEGYVKVGPDFPAMGEHWVNGELVVRGEFDAARPAILTYATIRGEVTLTGAVYAIAIGPGQKVPDALPGAHWHDHVGSIDEESLLFGHDGVTGGDSVRLAVMHAWVWVENPAGTFATDNWSLPFARVGAQAPPNVPPDAARAMALVSGGGAYYAMLFASVGQLGERDADAVRGIIARHAERISEWWRSRSPGVEISRQDLEWLSASWASLEKEVERAVPAEAAKRLKRI